MAERYVTPIFEELLIDIAYTVADIGGASSRAWLAIANTLALAAIAPFAGAISDLIGRRYVSMLGALLVVIGMIIVGTAKRMDVAIGGMAIAGTGAGLAELIGAAGVAELAPVRSRGKYIGTIFFLILPFSASAAYGSFLVISAGTDFSSPIICRFVHVEMGCMDLCNHKRRNPSLACRLLLASTSCELSWPYQDANPRSYRLLGWPFVG